jgi:transcriptional regulator with XRE-family HTH domain
MPLDELEELVAAGATAYELADRYGLHEVTVRQVCERHGLKLRPMRPSLDEETAQAICAAYAEGFTYAELAERFGVSRHWIAWLARKGRLTPRPRWVVRAPVEEILTRYDAGERASRIAEGLGVNERTVRFWVSKHRRSLPPALHPEALREAVRAGAEVRDIAAQAGVSLTLCYEAIAAAHASSLLARSARRSIGSPSSPRRPRTGAGGPE